MRAEITIKTINNLFNSLNILSQEITKSSDEDLNQIIKPEDFVISQNATEIADELKILFDKNGSDKAREHNYHLIYASLLKNKEKISNIVEIGLGTKNPDVVSNVIHSSVPGESLKGLNNFS